MVVAVKCKKAKSGGNKKETFFFVFFIIIRGNIKLIEYSTLFLWDQILQSQRAFIFMTGCITSLVEEEFGHSCHI